MAGGMEPGAHTPDGHDLDRHDDGRGHGHGHGVDGHGGHDGHESPSNGARLSEPRRRNRPALSCIQCRTRKIRCDRNEPCASCIKSKIVNCTYEEARRPKPRLWKLSPAPSSGPSRFNDGQSGDGSVSRFAAEPSYREPQPSASTPSGMQYASSAASVPSVMTSDSASTSLPSPPGRYADPSATGIPNSDSLLRTIVALEQEITELRRRDPVPLSSQSSQSTHSSHPAPTPTQPTISKARYVGSSHWMNDAKLVRCPLPLDVVCCVVPWS